MSSEASCPAPGDVHVWHAETGVVWRDADRVARARGWLRPDEQARYTRYRRDQDREMFLLGRVMTRALVGRALGVPPANWEWREAARGRPIIADPPLPLSFNLAHSAGVVVCALAQGGDVGVDVEDRERPPISTQLVRHVCSPAEAADVNPEGAAGWRDRFLQYWTLKEAYLKARGLGISVHLPDISFALIDGGARISFLNSLAGTDAAWAFTLSELGPTHYVAAAAPIMNGHPPRFVIEPFPANLWP